MLSEGILKPPAGTQSWPLAASHCTGRKRLGNVDLKHLLVALVVGDPHDFVPQHVFGALRHPLEQRTQLIVGRVSHQRTDVFEAVEDEAHVAVSALLPPRFALLRLLEDADLRLFSSAAWAAQHAALPAPTIEHVVVVYRVRQFHLRNDFTNNHMIDDAAGLKLPNK